MRVLTGETIELVGERVRLQGWVHNKRDHGKLLFLDLRDRQGILQVVFHKDSQKAYRVAKKTSLEDVISVSGLLKGRDSGLENKDLETGGIELACDDMAILNSCQVLPFEVNGEGDFRVREDLRLRYRYLDLRRPEMRKKMVMRSEVMQIIRRYFIDNDFLEVETPLLTKSTPEGARDFIVPSRLQSGKFYALPQSPQQYKQLLMVGGIERYFQIARCIRDEDLRSNRVFEHTQIDLEMSFVEAQDVMQMVEGLFLSIMQQFPDKKLTKVPFPRISHKEALKKYGADKFDCRDNPDDPNEVAFAWVVDFPAFAQDSESGKWTYEHNPFSGIEDQDAKKIKEMNLDELDSADNQKVLAEARACQWDLVCNGYELGSGSIRNVDSALLEKFFRIIGHDEKTVQKQFGHMLEALSLGAPPHGGMGLGLDRFMMILTGSSNIKETIAFPTTGSGMTAVMQAPDYVERGQLMELGLGLLSEAQGSLLDKIVAMMKERQIDFEHVVHEPVFSCEQAADVRGDELSEVAKSLVLKTKEGKFVQVVIAASEKVDSKKLRQVLQTKKTKFASREELLEITGLEPGAIPPLGNLFQLPVYIDKSLVDQQSVVFNAGTNCDSIRLRTSDLLSLFPAKVVEVS